MRARLLLATTAVAVLALGAGVSSAFACGKKGFTYAGIGAPTTAYGVRAVITTLSPYNVISGHIAGWVGVGGYGQGPNGTNEWIQVGISGFPNSVDDGTTTGGGDIYYEVTKPGQEPVYTQVLADPPPGTAYHVSVAEIPGRPNWWRVSLNHRIVSPDIYLPGSDGKWKPIATAESWDGGTGGACNDFLYKFQNVAVATRQGSAWRPLLGGYPIVESMTKIAAKGSSFFAAEGAAPFHALLSLHF